MSPLSGFTTVELATSAAAAATAVVGLYIGYQAYRGMRRNDSAPMWYLSVGMVLLFGVAYATAFAGTTLFRLGTVPLVYQGYFRLVVRLIQLAGVLCIAYSLFRTRGDARDRDRTAGTGESDVVDGADD